MSQSTQPSITQSQTGTKLSASIEAFLSDCEARKLQPTTVKCYADELWGLYRFVEVQSTATVESVTKEQLMLYLLDLAKAGRNEGGMSLAYRTIKAFLRWYERTFEPVGWRNPITKVPNPKRFEDKFQAVPWPTVETILGVCERGTFTGDRDRALILTLASTGARAEELLAMDIGDVTADRSGVTIRSIKQARHRTLGVGRDGKAAVETYLGHRPNVDPGEALWLTDSGERLTYSGLRQLLRRRAEKAGVEPPSVKSFRHAVGLGCLQSGMEPSVVRQLLGHSDQNTIHRYQDQIESDLHGDTIGVRKKRRSHG